MQNINISGFILSLTFKYWLGSKQHVSERHFHMHHRDVLISTLAASLYATLYCASDDPLP